GRTRFACRLGGATGGHLLRAPATGAGTYLRRQRLAGVHVLALSSGPRSGMYRVPQPVAQGHMPTKAAPTVQTSPGLLPWLAWATASFFFFYAWIMRVAPSVMVEELMREFAVGAGVLGNLSAAYFYGYAGMQIPVGLMLDRFGPRRLITIATIVCAGGCVLFATGSSLAAVTAGRF